MEVVLLSQVKIGDRELSNLITNKGLELFIKLMTGGISQSNYPNYVPQQIAIGTGTTEAKETDTSLEAEYTRKNASRSYSANTVKFHTVFEFSEEVDISEAGLVRENNLYSRVVFSPISCVSGSKLEVRWSLCLARK